VEVTEVITFVMEITGRGTRE